MNLRKTVTSQVFRLLQTPRVMELASNPRVMTALMKVLAARGRVEASTSAAIDAMAKNLGLATRDEVRELRRMVRRLEEQLAQEHAAAESRKGTP